MPNWADNIITIRGKRQTLGRIKANLKSKTDSEPLALNSLRPCPEALLNDEWQTSPEIAAANKRAYGQTGWYDWRVKCWGTKWEVENVTFHEDKDSITYAFQSAWSPVSAWVKYLSSKYPTVTVSHEFHEEGGMYPSAVDVYEQGSLLSSKEIPNANVEGWTDGEENE
jgi:hypothetical protein